MKVMFFDIIVTSRSVSFLQYDCIASFDVRIELIGLSEHGKANLIETSLSTEKQELLHNYLSVNPMIKDYCSIPLNLAVLIAVFKQHEVDTPKTFTWLYEWLILNSIKQNIFKHNKSESIKSLTSIKKLPSAYKEIIAQIAKITYLSFKHYKIWFDENDDDVVWDSNILCNIDKYGGLGLLHATSHVGEHFIPKKTYQFVHLCVHEFLVAIHIASLNCDEQLAHLETHFWEKKFTRVWHRYCGYSEETIPVFIKFLTGKSISEEFKLLPKFLWSTHDCIKIFQCFLEAERLDLCQHIVNSSKFTDSDQCKELSINCFMFSTQNLHMTQAFILNSSVEQWKLLRILNCKLGNEKLISLCSTFLQANIKVCTLDVTGNKLSQKSIPMIIEVVKNCSIKKIILNQNEFNENNCCCQLVRSTTLEKLEITNNNLQNSDMANLCVELSSNKCLTVLDVSGNKLMENIGEAIKDMLIANDVLKQLLLANNNLSSRDAIKIFEGLKENQYLQYLNLSGNDLKDDAAQSIANCLKKNSSLRTLNLAQNPLTGVGALEILDEIKGIYRSLLLQLPSYCMTSQENGSRLAKIDREIKGCFLSQLCVKFDDHHIW